MVALLPGLPAPVVEGEWTLQHQYAVERPRASPRRELRLHYRTLAPAKRFGPDGRC